MRKYASSIDFRNLSICIVILLLTSALSVAQHAKILHAFAGPNDGRLSEGALIADNGGNLYGTTASGGAHSEGIVFELSPSTGDGPWAETVLYSFTGEADGGEPFGSLVFDANGNLYGTTSLGGDSTNCEGGCGTVFELTPPSQQGGRWTETTIYTFQGGSDDGGISLAGVILDAVGNLYGTTNIGGGIGVCAGVGIGCGTVFELSPPATQGGAWTETVLYSFTGGEDGANADAPVVLDSTGNLFGTTVTGGSRNCLCGTVYELTPSGGIWTVTVLHKFGASGVDGINPSPGGLLLDKSGSLAGTTVVGGAYQEENGVGGTVFGLQLQQGGKWQYAVLYSFGGTQSDANTPEAGVIFGGNKILYGTTLGGGSNGAGAVYQLTRTAGGVWKETGLYSPSNLSSGYHPRAGLLLRQGVLYGTTGQGGKGGDGVVFRISQ